MGSTSRSHGAHSTCVNLLHVLLPWVLLLLLQQALGQQKCILTVTLKPPSLPSQTKQPHTSLPLDGKMTPCLRLTEQAGQGS